MQKMLSVTLTFEPMTLNMSSVLCLPGNCDNFHYNMKHVSGSRQENASQSTYLTICSLELVKMQGMENAGNCLHNCRGSKMQGTEGVL